MGDHKIVAEDFASTAPDELTLKKDTLVIVLHYFEDGWVKLQTLQGDVGLFPGTYLDDISNKQAPSKPPPTAPLPSTPPQSKQLPSKPPPTAPIASRPAAASQQPIRGNPRGRAIRGRGRGGMRGRGRGGNIHASATAATSNGIGNVPLSSTPPKNIPVPQTPASEHNSCNGSPNNTQINNQPKRRNLPMPTRTRGGRGATVVNNRPQSPVATRGVRGRGGRGARGVNVVNNRPQSPVLNSNRGGRERAGADSSFNTHNVNRGVRGVRGARGARGTRGVRGGRGGSAPNLTNNNINNSNNINNDIKNNGNSDINPSNDSNTNNTNNNNNVPSVLQGNPPHRTAPIAPEAEATENTENTTEQEQDKSAELSDEKRAKRAAYRKNVIKEIIDTENEYVNDLNIIVEVFLNPLEQEKKHLISTAEINLLFSNIKVLAGVNEAVAEKFTRRQNNDIVMLGDIFLDMADFFKMYTIYCANQPVALSTLEKLQETSSGFSNFLAECLQNERCRGLSLFSFLIKPIQRICKYPLLLRDLLKKTEEDHPDFSDLNKAFDKIVTVVDYVNERKRLAENLQKILDIQHGIDGELDLLGPSRRFIQEGEATYVEKGKPRERKLYLFNDQLVITKPGTGRSKDKLRKQLMLVDVKIFDNSTMDGSATQFSIEITQRRDFKENFSLIFAFNSAEDKDQWLKLLKTNLKEMQRIEATALKYQDAEASMEERQREEREKEEKEKQRLKQKEKEDKEKAKQKEKEEKERAAKFKDHKSKLDKSLKQNVKARQTKKKPANSSSNNNTSSSSASKKSNSPSALELAMMANNSNQARTRPVSTTIVKAAPPAGHSGGRVGSSRIPRKRAPSTRLTTRPK